MQFFGLQKWEKMKNEIRKKEIKKLIKDLKNVTNGSSGYRYT